MSDANMSQSQIQTAMKYEDAIRDLADADAPWRLKDIESEEYDQSTHRKFANRGLIEIQERDRTWGYKWSLTQPARAWIDRRPPKRDGDLEYDDDDQDTLMSDGGLSNFGDGSDNDNDDNGIDYPDELEEIAEESETSLDEIKESYANLKEYGTPDAEALRATASRYDASKTETKSAHGNTGKTGKTSSLAEIGYPEGDWHNVEARVYGGYGHEHPSIKQKGVLVDGTNAIPFLIWSSDDGDSPDALEVDKSYRIDSAVTSDNQGALELHLNSATEVEEIDKDGVNLPEGVHE